MSGIEHGQTFFYCRRMIWIRQVKSGRAKKQLETVTNFSNYMCMKFGLYKHTRTVINTEKFRLLAKFNSWWQQRNTTGCTVEKNTST
jgi:hypothetical protein